MGCVCLCFLFKNALLGFQGQSLEFEGLGSPGAAESVKRPD